MRDTLESERAAADLVKLNAGCVSPRVHDAGCNVLRLVSVKRLDYTRLHRRLLLHEEDAEFAQQRQQWVLQLQV